MSEAHECEHRRSRVADSRAHDAIHYSGTRMFRSHPFRFRTARRRVCEECGARFNTYEMTEADVAQFQSYIAATVREAQAIAQTLQDTLGRLKPEFQEEP